MKLTHINPSIARKHVEIYARVIRVVKSLKYCPHNDSHAVQSVINDTVLEWSKQLKRNAVYWNDDRHLNNWFYAVARRKIANFWRSNNRYTENEVSGLQEWIDATLDSTYADSSVSPVIAAAIDCNISGATREELAMPALEVLLNKIRAECPKSAAIISRRWIDETSFTVHQKRPSASAVANALNCEENGMTVSVIDVRETDRVINFLIKNRGVLEILLNGELRPGWLKWMRSSRTNLND